MSIYRLLYVKCKTYFYFHVFYKCSTCFYISLTFDSVSVVVSLLDLTVFVVFDMHINWCLFTISILWLLYDKCKTCYYYVFFCLSLTQEKHMNLFYHVHLLLVMPETHICFVRQIPINLQPVADLWHRTTPCHAWTIWSSIHACINCYRTKGSLKLCQSTACGRNVTQNNKILSFQFNKTHKKEISLPFEKDGHV